ncbi:hypothetical protein, partial [Gorillibacterium massiliense]|uniref:hypothetical protein n=1 Tax=Gorillibacterium massiliense TaxID=1280390 RepID=UPI0005936436
MKSGGEVHGVKQRDANLHTGLAVSLPLLLAALAIVLLPAVYSVWAAALISALFLYRSGADAVFTLTAFFRFLRQAGRQDLLGSARFGAVVGAATAVAGAAALCLLLGTGPLADSADLTAGWAALAAAGLMLTLGARL